MAALTNADKVAAIAAGTNPSADKNKVKLPKKKTTTTTAPASTGSAPVTNAEKVASIAAGTNPSAGITTAAGSPLNQSRDAQVRQSWAARPTTERFAPTTSASGQTKKVPQATATQRLSALSSRISQNEQQLTNMGLQMNRLQTAFNKGDYSVVDQYNALADRYNKAFNTYVSDVEAYNQLYRSTYRDQGVRDNYARRQYMEQRQAARDQGSRQLYQQRLQEEALRAPITTTTGKENERVVTREPNRFERVVGAGLSGTASGFTTAGGLVLQDQFNEHDSRTLRRKGASVGEHSYKRISGEEPREAGYTYSVTPEFRQRMARAKLTADGLIDTGRRLNNRSTLQTEIAKEDLGETGQMLVDLGVMAVQMAADLGIAAATGGSMLVPLGIRSYGNGYLTAEQMGYTGDAAKSYALGVAAVEVLSEKMFSVFGIVNKYAKGVITQELSERVIDGLVKKLATSTGGRTALNRLFTILFSSGSEGLEEVVAGVLEPLIRKCTLDPSVKAWKEIDWQETLYEGLLGGILGGLGGAIDLKNTRPTYWKYYKEGIDEGIQRYEAAVRKYGLESQEAMAAAKDVWSAGNKKMNQVAGFIVGANEDGTGGKWVPLNEATTEDFNSGLPVTLHQYLADREAARYGRRNEKGEAVMGPQISDSLYLGKYLQQEENARKEAENQRIEAARREEAARLEEEEKARVATEKPAQSAPVEAGASDEGIVRLDTARSAQNRTDVNNVTPAESALSGIPEEEMTQEEKDELQYGSGAVENLGQYTGLARRMGAPSASLRSAEVASSPAANIAAAAAETSQGAAEQGEYTNIKGGVSNDQLYDGSSQRDAGERGGEGPESLGGTAAGSEGGPVPAQRGSDGGAAEAAGGIPRVRKNESQRSKIKKRQSNGAVLEKTSGAAQGIEQTDDRTTMQIYTDEMVEADAELAEIKDELEAQGFDVHFHLGPIGVEGGREAAGAHQGNEVWIRVDHPKWTAAQIAKHEYLHGKIHRNKELLTELLTKLVSDGNFARLSRISTRYQESMMLTAEGDNENATLILEEMVCDLYAGMKEFASEDEDARSLHEMIQDEVNSRQAEGELETRGPPESGETRFSSDSHQPKINPTTRGDLDNLRKVREKVSVKSFTSDETTLAQKWAARFWQDLKEKSPFFAAWFGDWRAYDTSPIRVADIAPGLNVKEAYKKQQDTYYNPDTTWNIRVSKDGRGDTVSHSGSSKKSVYGLVGIRELLENAILLDTESHEMHGKYKDHPEWSDVAFDHKLYSLGLTHDGTLGLYRITVEDSFKGRNNPSDKRFHHLRYIEKVADLPAGALARETQSLGNLRSNVTASGASTTNSSITDADTFVKAYDRQYTVADVYAFVKQYDHEFTPAPAVDRALLENDGKPKRMYRGDPEQFYVFDRKKAKSSGLYGRGFYFTSSPEHASQYGDVREFFLNVRRPLSPGQNKISKEQMRRFLQAVAEDEDYGLDNYGYGSTVESVLADVYGKGDFEMLQDVNASCIGDLVAALELFNQVNDTKYDGIITPTETVVLDSTQIKSATDNIGTFDKNNPDVRFSMDEPVEEQGGLVALHNLNADKLSKALDLGGFPMPSIAVTKADIPHTNFGDITLVMDRSTVDPQADRRNKVYSADAWTPTFPQTEYEVNEDVAGRLRDKFYELESRYGRQMVDELYRYGNTLEESLNRYGGVEGILDRERDNDRMKLVYLLDTGKEVPEPTIKETVSRMNDRDIIKCDVLIKALGEDTLKELAVRDGEKVGDARRRWWADHGEEMERAYEEYLRLPELNFSEDEIARIQNWMSKAEYIKEAVEARNYLTRGPEKVTEEQDYSARDKAIADVDQADYEAWLEDLFAGAVKDSGIRNSKDIFTPSGNRRSFKATHYPVTLDNIARAMAEENGGNSKNTSGFHGTKTLRAGTSYKFRSIPQMHKLEGRLRHLTEEEALEINRALDGRLMELIDRIDKRRTYGSSESNPFIRMDSIGETLEEIAETGSWGTAQVKRIFAKYSYDLSEDICQDVTDLLTDINNMPVNIFEAKPQRAVRFDEVRAAIVPDTTEPALIDRLREAGVEDVRTYPKGDNDSRLAEVNAVPNVRFAMDEEEPTDKEGDLAEQLRKAQRQAAYWEKQAKRTEHPTLREKDVEKLTKSLLEGYESKADRAEMAGRIKELGEYILNGGPDLVWDEVQARAEQIAGDILDRSERVDDYMWRETAELRRYLRTTRIKIDPDLRTSKGFFPEGYNNFRKKYYGRLLLTNDGQNVDSVYTEAAGMWPGLLPDPEDVYSEGEALNNLVELLDSAPPRRYNPYEEGDADTDMDAARSLLANDIIDGLLSENVRQEPPTVADKLAAEAARRKAAPAIREEARRQKTDEAIEQLQAEGGEARNTVPQTAGELQQAAVKAKQKSREAEKILRSLRLTPKENALANDILAGTLTLNELHRNKYDEPVDKSKVERAYEAKKAAREAAAPVEEYNRARREGNINEAEELIKDSDEWKDKKNFFAYSRETGRRIFQDLTKDTAQANALIRTYIDPIREHEAEKNRMVSRYNDRIKALKIETRVRHGNKVSEAYAIQYIGELEFIRDWLEQLPEGETRGDVTYQEAMTLLHEFWAENPNLDQDRIHAAVAEFRSIYDEIFAMVNEARVLNGYAPIDYRKGYFPHFTSDTGDNIIESLARGMGLGVEVTELPTSIAGTTHLFRPGIQWSGHMLSRTGNKTDYNVLEGWDRYIPAVANIIYHTEDIQRLRALETAIRHKYSDTTVRDEIDATRRSRDLTAPEINAKLDELFKRDVTQLNYFVQWLREYTNQLAGKKAELDRNVEKFIGRNFYQRIQQVENRVAANMLGGNISSAMTNFVPLFQAWANVRTSSMMRAMWDTGVAAIRGDGFRDGSDFLINRRGYDAMYQTLYGKTKNALFIPFNIIDDFVSETIVRARYYDELHNNPMISPEVALANADTFAGSVLADRAIGELPVIFNSKNPLVKVFTMFQVEVNNDLSHLLKDIPREAKKKGMAALVMSVLKYMLGVYMFNDLFEWLFGRRVSLDPLDMLNDLVGDATGYQLPNMFESAVLIAKGEWDGWEEFENGKGGNFLSDLVADMKEWADDLPFISGLLGGGRFPIQAMLPDEGAVKAGWEATRDILKGEDQENTNEYDLSKMYKAVRNPLTYWAMPAFGGQLRKIAEGIYAYTQHGSYSQTKQGKVLQYPILDYRDLVKAMVFGKTTTRYGKEWVKSDFDSLTAPQTQTYINLVAGGSDPQLIYEMLHDLKGTDRTAAEKAYALATAKLSDGERIMLFGALDRDKEADNFADLMSAGLSFRQCAEVLDEWTPLKAQADLTAEGDEGKPERTRLATQFAGWLDDEGYTDEQKEVILDNYKLGATPIRYDWLVRDGISNNGALELAMDWAELTPEAGKNSVSANQKIDAVADAGYLTEKEKHIAVRSLLSDDVRQEDGGSRQTDYDKYVKGYDISVEVFNQYLKVTTGVKGVDRDGDGKTDSGSKRDALFAAINTLPLQAGQKTALALYQGDYSESSIRKNAPWLR